MKEEFENVVPMRKSNFDRLLKQAKEEVFRDIDFLEQNIGWRWRYYDLIKEKHLHGDAEFDTIKEKFKFKMKKNEKNGEEK